MQKALAEIVGPDPDSARVVLEITNNNLQSQTVIFTNLY
jgi:hypothetical protein